jgi:putative spermidine/putrescine transport system ATP-binding protein
VPGIVESVDGGQCRIGFTGGESLVCRANGFAAGARVVVSIRPERLRLATTPGPGRLRAKVGLIMPLGPTLVYDLTLATGTPVRVAASRPELAAVPVSGSEIFLEPTAADACLLFPEPASQQAGAKQ